MKLIAHRGNTNGPIPQHENSPDYIDEAINAGFDVEVDAIAMLPDNKIYLGHDRAQHEVSKAWLWDRKKFLWVHCKNVRALDIALNSEMHCFAHDVDFATLTSKGYIWSYPGREIQGRNTVIVMPERQERYKNLEIGKNFHAVCSDYVSLIKEINV